STARGGDPAPIARAPAVPSRGLERPAHRQARIGGVAAVGAGLDGGLEVDAEIAVGGGDAFDRRADGARDVEPRALGARRAGTAAPVQADGARQLARQELDLACQPGGALRVVEALRLVELLAQVVELA